MEKIRRVGRTIKDIGRYTVNGLKTVYGGAKELADYSGWLGRNSALTPEEKIQELDIVREKSPEYRSKSGGANFKLLVSSSISFNEAALYLASYTTFSGNSPHGLIPKLIFGGTMLGRFLHFRHEKNKEEERQRTIILEQNL